MSSMQANIAENLRVVRQRIAEACSQCGRRPDEVTIVAISKTHPAEVIRQAVAAGISDIGESRVQEAEAKFVEVGKVARFHLVGHLQSNKVKKAVKLFDVIQSVDSLSLAQEIDRRAAEISRVIDGLIEVNCSAEPQKHGVLPTDAISLVREVVQLKNVKLCGLMTVGPLSEDDQQVRDAFRLCRELFEQARPHAGPGFKTLSMGMTDDFPLAIAEGSTMIRVGTGIFGVRQVREG